MKLAALILGALLSLAPCSLVWAANPSNIPVTATIASLRVIPATAAAQYQNIQVQDYYGTSSGCPIQYRWNSSDSTADNGGAVINPTGNGGAGRWNLNLPPNSPVHTCVFGVVNDSTPSAGTGTDQSSRLQAALDWANTLGPNWVHIDGKKDMCIRLASVLTPGQGEIIEGDGMFIVTGSTNQGTCLSRTDGAGYVFALQTPYPNFGLIPYESPKFKDFSMVVFDNTTAAGGCIQLNSIAGGFTDTSATQQPILNPRFTNLFCNMRALNNSTKIGIQLNKTADGVIEQVRVFGGNNAFDIEGSENITIRNSNISGTFGPNVKLQRQNTFGNNDIVQNNQLLGFSDFGQTVDSIVYDDARESTVSDNLFEFLPSGITLTSHIHLINGFLANIRGNAITGTSTNWLLVDGTYNGINAIGNSSNGGLFNSAKFLAGKYLYSIGGIQSVLNHSGNQTEGGFPFVSQPAIWDSAPKVRETYSPNYPGLNGNGYGFTELPINQTFAFPVTGSGNYLDFNGNSFAAITGTFDAQILAFQQSGTGQITCQLTDGGTLVGASIAQATTATPTWYTLAFNQAITTSAAIRCWNTGTGTGGNQAFLAQINIVDH